MDEQNQPLEGSLEPGEGVYNDDGRLVGRVRSLTTDGFEIESVETGETDAEDLPGQEFGEGYLMWRCGECGEMGGIEDGLPDRCPDCGAPREALENVRED